MRAAAAVLAASVIFTVAVGTAHAAAPITMSGDEVTENLIADLAFFYRHNVHHAPRFELAGGGTGAGLSDVARGVTEAGLVSRRLNASDPPGSAASAVTAGSAATRATSWPRSTASAAAPNHDG